MESFSKRVQSLAAGLFILGLLGCGQEDRIHLDILAMRDTARDFDRAVISLSRIELLREDDPGPLSLGQRRFVELVTPSSVGIWRPSFPRDPSLSPGPTVLVSAEIPVGSYRAVRLAISGGFIEVLQTDGSIKSYISEGYDVSSSNAPAAGALSLSEEAVSGFDVMLPGETTLGTQPFQIRLNLDVARSFSQDTAGVNRWVLHPHVTAETRP